MDQQTLPQLDRARLLDAGDKYKAAVQCKICGSTSLFFDVVDFNKCCSREQPYNFGPAHVGVSYYRCEECQFTFTTFFDQWDGALFRRYIYNDQYIQVDPDYVETRPVETARALSEMLRGYERLRLLDYGSGSGVQTAVMRQGGYRHVTEYDPFASPVRPAGRFDIITCFETIEHVPDPLATIRDMTSMLAKGGCIIIGTSLQPADFDVLRGSWWYVAPRNGHVSIFSLPALQRLAAREGLVVYGTSAPLVLAASQPRWDIAPLVRFFDELSSPAREPPPDDTQGPASVPATAIAPTPAPARAGTAGVRNELAYTMRAVNRLARAARASLERRTRTAVPRLWRSDE